MAGSNFNHECVQKSCFIQLLSVIQFYIFYNYMLMPSMVMVVALRYRSFFLGIVLTSFVWAVIVYLYSDLGQSERPKISLSRQQFKKRLKPRYENLMFENHHDKINLSSEERHSQKNKDLQIVGMIGSVGSLKSGDLLQLGVVRNWEDQQVKEEGHRHHAFNLLISNRLGYHRDVPDTRHFLCKSKRYSSTLPSASVIICFYNEALSTLLRTVHSVLDRSPPDLLHEVILLDDNSSD
ncbi:polypeptide N-acetylgalactosaminyltransferase 11-like, partial [Limulus polyphemus]|uniref:Polypeptide N-acetylgalactosaminyltransferase 11-like n=1 Tax=Limulus polyphemus TaxID=6850 RepID=A0ABM1RZC1_LIMPO